VAEELARTSETGYAPSGTLRSDSRCGDLGRYVCPLALDAAVADTLQPKTFGTLLETPQEKTGGGAAAFTRLSVPLVKRGWIEGVYESCIRDVPIGEVERKIRM
jgi:hypothetical protein